MYGEVDGNRWNWFCKHSVWISKRTLGRTPIPRQSRTIHFRDMEGTEQFSLLDGENLCMMAEDGTKEIGLCRFVDEKQVDVNGQVWEIGEFLWQMERRGIQVYPLQTA